MKKALRDVVDAIAGRKPKAAEEAPAKVSPSAQPEDAAKKTALEQKLQDRSDAQAAQRAADLAASQERLQRQTEKAEMKKKGQAR